MNRNPLNLRREIRLGLFGVGCLDLRCSAKGLKVRQLPLADPSVHECGAEFVKLQQKHRRFTGHRNAIRLGLRSSMVNAD